MITLRRKSKPPTDFIVRDRDANPAAWPEKQWVGMPVRLNVAAFVPRTVIVKGRRWIYESMPNLWRCGADVMMDEFMVPLLRRRRSAMHAAYRRKKRGWR